MRFQFKNLHLVGTTRNVPLEPGLNIIAGPIGTGKSNFLKLIHGLAGGSFGDLATEVKSNVAFVAATVEIGDQQYEIVRPLSPEDTGKVEIAGGGESLRIPAARPLPGAPTTYSHWILNKVGLPNLKVPSAPTKADSAPTTLSINDFLFFCYLRQDGIDNGVMGSENSFKNTKRKYVFEVLYGMRGERQAELEAQLRHLENRIRALSENEEAFQVLLKDTPWANRAALREKIVATQRELEDAQAIQASFATAPRATEGSVTLRRDVLAIEEHIAATRNAAEKHLATVGQLRLLINQLDAQSSRLVRSIVAAESFVGFEFLTCPRCSAAVAPQRSHGATCYLCLQEPAHGIEKPSLVAEQERIENQIAETYEVLAEHEAQAAKYRDEEITLRSARDAKARDLDAQTLNYVSDEAARIARVAAEVASAEANLHRLRDYEGLFSRLDEAKTTVVQLQGQRDEVERLLQEHAFRKERTEQMINNLESEFVTLVDKFQVPKPANPKKSSIDRNDFMPLAYGQKFKDLSQGTKVLVHVAYAIAQHKTILEYNLPLPGLLIIDGITDNIGKEGLDLTRVLDMYAALADLSDTHGDRLQIIVGDHEDIPAAYARFVRLQLRDDDKLVPGLTQDRTP